MDVWKSDPHSPFYQHQLIQQRLINLRMFHWGVIKALRERKLLPRVVSGSSAGAVVAAFLGTRKDSELDALFAGDGMDFKSWQRLGLREMLKQKSTMDHQVLERCLRQNLGEYTFEEAFKRTKRIINITVSQLDKTSMRVCSTT